MSDHGGRTPFVAQTRHKRVPLREHLHICGGLSDEVALNRLVGASPADDVNRRLTDAEANRGKHRHAYSVRQLLQLRILLLS